MLMSNACNTVVLTKSDTKMEERNLTYRDRKHVFGQGKDGARLIVILFINESYIYNKCSCHKHGLETRSSHL